MDKSFHSAQVFSRSSPFGAPFALARRKTMRLMHCDCTDSCITEEKRMAYLRRHLRSRRLRWPALVAVIGLMAVVSDAAGPWPYAVGGGDAMDPTDLSSTDHFAFSALQGPSACRGPQGSLGHGRFDLADGVVQGPVSCVNVQGNQAVFVVQNDKGSNPATSLRVYVQDNGEPGALVDQIGWQTNPPPALPNQSQCDALGVTQSIVIKGNIQVRFEEGGCPPNMQQR